MSDVKRLGTTMKQFSCRPLGNYRERLNEAQRANDH